VYEAVTAHPEGKATLSRFAETAARYGYDGIVRRAGTTGASLETVRTDVDIDVVDAVEIDTMDPSVLAGTLGTERERRTLVIVSGGNDRINRQAVEDPRVDVLSKPMQAGGDVNHVLAASAARNGVRLEFDFGPVLRQTGGRRVRALSKLRKLRELVDDAGAPFVVSGSPMSHLHLRAPRELRAVGEVVGFDSTTVEQGLEEWGELATRNRHRASDHVVEPGVEVEDAQEGDTP
jgi:ribonuclease P/MRP protein subunit RPP1